MTLITQRPCRERELPSGPGRCVHLFDYLIELASADKLADHRVLRDEALVDVSEQLDRRQHLSQLVEALDPLRYRLEQFRGRAVEHRELIGK